MNAAKRISLSKERVTGQGSGAVLIPNGVHAASGKLQYPVYDSLCSYTFEAILEYLQFALCF